MNVENAVYMLSKSETFFQTLMRKLKSHRVIWCYIYLVLYCWMCVYSVLKYPSAVNTVIMTTGGMVSLIFSVYILGSTYENVQFGNQASKIQVPNAEVNKNTDER